MADSADAPAETTAAATKSASGPRTVDAGWVLALTVAFICLLALIWSLSSGPAATGWLIALIASALFVVPLALLVLKLMGVEDDD